MQTSGVFSHIVCVSLKRGCVVSAMLIVKILVCDPVVITTSVVKKKKKKKLVLPFLNLSPVKKNKGANFNLSHCDLVFLCDRFCLFVCLSVC